jgi:hypothetical protein
LSRLSLASNVRLFLAWVTSATLCWRISMLPIFWSRSCERLTCRSWWILIAQTIRMFAFALPCLIAQASLSVCRKSLQSLALFVNWSFVSTANSVLMLLPHVLVCVLLLFSRVIERGYPFLFVCEGFRTFIGRMKESDQLTEKMVHATSKACPKCGVRIHKDSG